MYHISLFSRRLLCLQLKRMVNLVDSFPRVDDPGKACKISKLSSWAGSCCSSTSAQRNLRLHLWPRSQNGGAKTTASLSTGLRDWKHQTGHFWRLSSPSSVNERVAFGLLYLPAFSKLFRLAARALRDISNSFAQEYWMDISHQKGTSECFAGGPIGYQARTRRH